MSPAPDCSYQSILSFNNRCRLPTGGRSRSGRMVPGPTLCTLVLTSEDTPRTHWWMAARRTSGDKLQKCWSFKVCPWTGSKHSRSAGPLQWAMVVGWWIVEWHEMCGQQRRIETYFTPSLAIDGGAAGGPDPAETNCNGSHSIGHSTATEANTNLYLVWQMHFDCFCEDLNTGTRASTLKCYCYTIQ